MGKDTENVSMKKICFFVNSGWYFELHWLDRANALKNGNNEVHIVSNFSDAEMQRLGTQGFHCHQTGMRERSLKIFHAISDFFNSIKILKRINPDLIHCITIKPIIIGGLFSRFMHKPFIASFVGLGRVFMIQTCSYKLLKRIVGFIYKLIFKNKKSLLLFEHENDQNILLQLISIPRERCVVINGSGVDLEKFNYVQEEDSLKPSVLFASRLLWCKGLGDLVKIKKDISAHIEFDLNVAGISVEGDPDSIPLSTIDVWNEESIITWLGKRDDISNLIESNSIVVLPSTYFEGVPRILIEAAAKGRPIIAYDTGGCGNILHNGINGYLIEKGNIDELKNKIIFLLSDINIRRHMGENGRRLVETHFGSVIIIKQTMSAYSRILSS
ncbi:MULTISPECIES: glycosyltransferase family 4 protein [Pantoea]|uniref:glycosyltransferase family 4 protein n=1 Tax=Gammaproteobacteria TaxID=1236 RepID=UPI0023036DAA|nr:glycosyltransferase family 4 protein [Pantoea sp. CTOTU46764]